MKYIVPKEKLENIIFKYLDLTFKGVKTGKAANFNGIVFYFGDDDNGVMGYNTIKNIIYVDREIRSNIAELFKLNYDEIDSLIMKWFENKFELPVSKLGHYPLLLGNVFGVDKGDTITEGKVEPHILMAMRRIHFVDFEVNRVLNGYLKSGNLCSFYSNADELLAETSYDVLRNLYFNTFNELDDSSIEWNEIYMFIEKYIEEKYKNKIQEFYHINCGN